MKLITSIIVFFSISISAMANDEVSSTVVGDKNSQALAKLLSGKAIQCKPSSRNRVGSGVFPITIRLRDLGQEKIEITVQTKENTFAGSGEYLTVEYSPNWMILRDGDDGWSTLFLNINLSDKYNAFDPESSIIGGVYAWQGGDAAFVKPQDVLCEIVN